MSFHTLLAFSPHSALYHLAVFLTETKLLYYLDSVHQCFRRFASETGRPALCTLYGANPEATERFCLGTMTKVALNNPDEYDEIQKRSIGTIDVLIEPKFVPTPISAHNIILERG
jgi:hypothetical protein